jgi:hypothetical protein
MLTWLCATASAADLHLTLDMAGRVEEVVWPSHESLSKRYGPVQMGKSSTVFLVTVSPSVFDPLEGAYRVSLSICAEWTRKTEHDQFCDRKELLVPGENATARHEVALKAKDKLEWAAEMWFTGEAPPSGMPPEALEQVEEADPAEASGQ